MIDGLESIQDAFWILNTDRPRGTALGPIPFTAIDSYAARFGFNEPEDFELLLDAIRAMDEKFLEVARRKLTQGGQNR